MDYDETFDERGKLISRVAVDRTEQAAAPLERIAELENKLAEVHATLDAVGKAASFDAAKTAIRDRMPDEILDLPVVPAEPVDKAGRG